jgi:hypothetical protein
MGIMKSHALKLFGSIFGGGGAAPGRYPESEIAAAIERAVVGTDSRLRFLPGYAKRLRAPVIHAMAHVRGLVAGIPAPLAAGRGAHGAEPRLAAVFASAVEMFDWNGGVSRICSTWRGRASPRSASSVRHSRTSVISCSAGSGCRRTGAGALSDRWARTRTRRRDLPNWTPSHTDWTPWA